jgi:response regulator RpfG family c-di-GMP phosphodiesterase
MDVQMPLIDGYKANQHINSFVPSLPIIRLTANAIPEERERCLGAGMAAHINKPVDRGHPVATLRSICRLLFRKKTWYSQGCSTSMFYRQLMSIKMNYRPVLTQMARIRTWAATLLISGKHDGNITGSATSNRSAHCTLKVPSEASEIFHGIRVALDIFTHLEAVSWSHGYGRSMWDRGSECWNEMSMITPMEPFRDRVNGATSGSG